MKTRKIRRMKKRTTLLPPPPTLIQSSVCTAITRRLQGLLDQASSFRFLVQASIATAVGTLTALRDTAAFSTLDAINQAFSDIDNNISSIVPPPPAFLEIPDLINACSFLQVDPFLSDPLVMVSFMLNDLKSECMDALFEITSLPEILLGRALADISGILSSSGGGLAIMNGGLLINCLQNMCGLDMTTQLNSLNSVLSATFVTPSGIFDPPSLVLSIGGIGSDIADNVNACTDKITNIYSSIEDNCSQAIDSFKNIAPPPPPPFPF